MSKAPPAVSVALHREIQARTRTEMSGTFHMTEVSSDIASRNLSARWRG
jgi:hypothetical protein